MNREPQAAPWREGEWPKSPDWAEGLEGTPLERDSSKGDNRKHVLNSQVRWLHKFSALPAKHLPGFGFVFFFLFPNTIASQALDI